MISFNAGHIRARDPLRKKIEEDMKRTTVPITVVAPTHHAIDHSKSKTTQERDATLFRKSVALKLERKAAEKARKAKANIKTMGEVVARHQKRSATQ